MQMDIGDSHNGKAVRITLSGRLDTLGVDQVETRFVAAAVAGGRDTLVDLSNVDLITSMGIRMLIGAARSMGRQHTRLVLFGAHDMVREALETAAIDTLIATVPDEAAALELVGG